jgi:RNA polymerase sigma-70 factor (ECF subfamily)
MGRIAAGDREAFAELFDRHSPVVLGVLMRLLGNRAEAEEVVQEVFLQAWHQADRYLAERASPRGWLLMLGRSRALDRIRSSRAARAREEALGREQRWAAAGGSNPTAGLRLEAGERVREVHGALAELPAEQRECIELAYWGGLTQTEIAERTGAPLGTVKSRVMLGMRKLREALST